MDKFYIVGTGCSGYWGEEFRIMSRGDIVGTALSFESAKRKLEEIKAGDNKTRREEAE